MNAPVRKGDMLLKAVNPTTTYYYDLLFSEGDNTSIGLLILSLTRLQA